MKKIIIISILLVAIWLLWFTVLSNNSTKSIDINVPGDSTASINTTSSSMNTTLALHTNRGVISVELFNETAPKTAENFQKLAQDGYYDGTKFHRVIGNFMIQGGDPNSKDDSAKEKWGQGGPGYAISDEFGEGLSNVRGTLSMANSGPDTGGSQFFINLVDNTGLDHDKEPLTSKHAVFGKVISGMDVVDAIAQTNTDQNGRPIDPIRIERIEIISSI